MNFKIGEIHPNSPHLLADLTELLLTIGYDGKNRIHKNDLESLLNTGTISHEEIDSEEVYDLGEKSTAEKNSREERQLEDLMSHLEFRAKALYPFYPFTVCGEELRISDDLTNSNKIYLFLLACSRLRSFEKKGIAQKWAKCFTNVSKIALEGLLPQHAIVRIFDANSDDRKSHYSTNLSNALKILGKELRVLSINDAECNKTNASGDAGLDLVAIVDFDDGAAGSFSVLGQCGAQETGWPKKTLEAHSMRYRNYFQMQFDFPGVMFTPVCYRTSDGDWIDNQSGNGIFLADRGRILQLIDKQNKFDYISEQDWFLNFENDFALAKIE